ncbi:MAG TPA: UvrD-helicase domain-containing protein [Solirubrobacteraceae bacterium]|nr:UvrD-helicase domain-containing protein [Solirubrobacteraceae bacterium]
MPQLETLPGMEPDGATTPDGEGPPLTIEQERAVSRRAEPLLVSAAAGSGKTSVLVERFVRAVREDGLAPGRILAITFTERSAGELRERVRARLLELGERQAARDTEAAFVGTFHGFCARLLRAHPLAAGLDPDYGVLGEGLAGRLRERAFELAARSFMDGNRSEAADLLAAYGVDRVRAMIEQVYLELRSRGELRPRLPLPMPAGDPAESDREAAGACALLDELLDRFGHEYELLKRARSAVDFDDLELLAQRLLLEREGIRRAWAERFALLMVDEFQDTNPRQLAILRALDRENLFTVGDELQSIYGFRHADVSLFRERRATLERRGGSLPLTFNFRSRAELLDVVNAVFAERFADAPELTAGRVETEPPDAAPAVELLLTDIEGWELQEATAERIAAGLPPAQTWRQAEARLLAQRIAELVRDGRARAGEIVVLLRASGDLEVFERALQLAGLRTLAAVGAFWGHQQIGDLVTYLRALANPLDEQALYGVLASPLGGCSRDCLALLARAGQAARTGLWDIARRAAASAPEPVLERETNGNPAEADRLLASLRPADRSALAAVVPMLEREREGASRRPIASLIERAVQDSGYRDHVLGLEWGERRLANVHKLLRLAREFEAGEGRDLRGFLDHVEYLQHAARVEPDAPVQGAEPDAVRLMTVHAAKGLEFPIVCVADLGRQPNARVPDLLVDGPRVGLRLMRLDGAGSSAALAYEELCAERRQREAEEEDRILYVAMTRARDLLVLSASVDFARWPRQGPGATPISWLGPAVSEQLPELLSVGHSAPLELRAGTGGAARVLLRLSSPGSPALEHAPAPAQGAEETPSRLAEVVGAGAEPARAGGLVGLERAAGPVRPSAERAGGSGEPGAADASADAVRISTLSYSSLTELERCGYRYYLERVLGIAEERTAAHGHDGEGGLEARARGTLVHRLMELIDFARPQPPSAEEVGERARELGISVDSGEREELARLIASSCETELFARVAAAPTLRREHPFAFSLAPSEPLISGVIDLLALEADGERLVLDYKSDRVGAEVDLEELVEREYGAQRLIYALAVLRDGAPAVEIVHWFLERREWAVARFDAADRLVLEEQLSQRIARTGEHPFAVSPSPHRGLCLTCPGRVGLCSWGEAETLREHP